ncbi:undecaprenyldiphospho-muramoylpentapeptide beta-N-acetylglucosaminyltransferase [Polynucleobacter sp. HIN6]|uniref:undecaprenyldiphospho-muramoylpentapeptide beta-N-acetylglucosaminyltransferase n=1 Tax=Polynucleobacter sp. HIN6 TaxID=3047865 RepID=UPI0025729E4C|nr:undecaprenyldiphospho-muramoylpentapeptide beta-N-acetylglucosaminyltransferase [Polynucleobacter sp. HIN6]BEI34640.1 undecaprenyldiphospho-muramoylpentapeptide beta-N-acetylglucosaminyltransferase [Polynucleobacter sp. HIN6]
MTMAGRSILVMAGGTGGHIFPGLAVAECLRKQGWSVSWMGNPSGMEYRLVPAKGFIFEGVQFGGLRGKGILTKLLMPFRLVRAMMQSWKILRRLKPSVVLGMGGYITFPGGLVSYLMGRPLVLHEANSVAGSANRVLARFATRVLTGFPHTLEHGQWVGNPIRESVEGLGDCKTRYAMRQGPLHLLVVGGSLGAAALNAVVPEALALLPADQRPNVMHQTGEQHLEAVTKKYQQLDVHAELKPFIEDMAAAYAHADLVICRAGAMTVSEISAAGVAACFVPFPYAIDDHQTANARFLSDAKAAILMPQAELDAAALANLILGLRREDLAEIAVKAQALAKFRATEEVASICKECAR